VKSENCERPDHLRLRILFGFCSNRAHAASFWGFLITHKHKHPVGLLWTCNQQKTLPTQRTRNTRDEYLMPSAGLEPAIPATKRLQTCALLCTATGICQVIPPSPPPVRGPMFYGHIQMHLNLWFDLFSLYERKQDCVFFLRENFTQHFSNVIVSKLPNECNFVLLLSFSHTPILNCFLH
jgi:hypothetical protein